jgi:hypothetical protein
MRKSSCPPRARSAWATFVVAALLVACGWAPPASATHVRPKGATPVNDSLVIAYKPCSTPGNRTHGGGLPFESCNPPEQQSPNLTVGSPPANGLPAKFIGQAAYYACPVMPNCAGVHGNIQILFDAADVRCRAALAAASPGLCTGGAALGTYNGEVWLQSLWRITDDNNDTVPASCGTSVACKTATMIDIPFPATAPCLDGHCNVSTTANSVVPGAITFGTKMNIQTGAVELYDGGPDGISGTPDNSVFATKGIFVP